MEWGDSGKYVNHATYTALWMCCTSIPCQLHIQCNLWTYWFWHWFLSCHISSEHTGSFSSCEWQWTQRLLWFVELQYRMSLTASEQIDTCLSSISIELLSLLSSSLLSSLLLSSLLLSSLLLSSLLLSSLLLSSLLLLFSWTGCSRLNC